MINVLLIHAGKIPHYRVPIYSYLSNYLKKYQYQLIVISDEIQITANDKPGFRYIKLNLSLLSIIRIIRSEGIDVIIDFIELKHRYLFPVYLIAKFILRKKMIYWGQGTDLLDSKSKIKKIGYSVELYLSDAIILYAGHLIKYLPKIFHNKVFIANNTLYLNNQTFPSDLVKEKVLTNYGITTKKNIICVGRMQKRKRIHHLIKAHAYMNRPDIGLILVGPDVEGILNDIEGKNIFKLGPLYGGRIFELLRSSDIYCLPGAVGLSIVDAFHCGLPFVTEDGDESAEIMYLKNGVNGFIVPKGDIAELANKIILLLDNDPLRKDFSDAASSEIRENGNIDKLCAGFRDAILFVNQNKN